MKDVTTRDGAFFPVPPETQGVDSRGISAFLDEIERQGIDLQSLYIFRGGEALVCANRKPYTARSRRRIYSGAKAITALAVLFAIDEGLLSLDTKLVSLFPEDLPPTLTPWMERMTIYHLLTMTTGHTQDTFRPIINGENSVTDFLSQPLDYEPGTYFLYNNGVPHILGLVVKQVAGEDYIRYLTPRLFQPLNIHCTVEETERGELEGSRTVCTAEGFAKLTLFFLQEGSWSGKQLLSAALIRSAGAFQVPSGRCSSISFMHTDQMYGYGFQLWRNSREGFRLDGGRSQFGFVFPDKNLAIACNAIEEDSGLIPTILWETLYPALMDGPMQDTQETRKNQLLLEQRLAHWSCAPKLAGGVLYRDDYFGREYTLEENSFGLQSACITVQEGRATVLLSTKSQKCTLHCGLNGAWVDNATFIPMPRENERLNEIFRIHDPIYRASGGWPSDFCFVLQVRATDWMDYHTLYFRFHGERLSLCVESNLEHMSHTRRRIHMAPRQYSDAPMLGWRS